MKVDLGLHLKVLRLWHYLVAWQEGVNVIRAIFKTVDVLAPLPMNSNDLKTLFGWPGEAKFVSLADAATLHPSLIESSGSNS